MNPASGVMRSPHLAQAVRLPFGCRLNWYQFKGSGQRLPCIELVVDEALDRRVSVRIESTWRDPEVSLWMLERGNSLGYGRHATVVTVPPQVRLVSTLSRFYGAPSASARWAPSMRAKR